MPTLTHPPLIHLSHCSVPTKFDADTAKIINAVVARFQDKTYEPEKDPTSGCVGHGVIEWFPTGYQFDVVYDLLQNAGKLDEFYSLVPDEQRTLVLNLLKDEGVILK